MNLHLGYSRGTERCLCGAELELLQTLAAGGCSQLGCKVTGLVQRRNSLCSRAWPNESSLLNAIEFPLKAFSFGSKGNKTSYEALG